MKSHTRHVKKLDRKRVLICLLIFFALLPVFSYIHEAGHALVCLADGNEPEITVDIFRGGTTLCHGDHVSNLFAYKISGGLLAGIIGILIVVQPDLGTAIMIFLTLLVFIGCENSKQNKTTYHEVAQKDINMKKSSQN